MIDAVKALWGEGFAWFTEVGDCPGYPRRRADALCLGVWASKGFWFRGFEVKRSLSDFKRELAEDKSGALQRFCREWYLVCPPALWSKVEGLLPDAWGAIVADGHEAKRVRKAPEVEAEPPTMAFVASILRQTAQAREKELQHAVAEATRREREACGGVDAAALEMARDRSVDRCQRLQRALDEAQEKLRAYGHQVWGRPEEIGRAVQTVQRLRGAGGRLRVVADSLQALASEVDAMEVEA